MRDEYADHNRPPGRRKRRPGRRMYLHFVELLTIALSYLGRSRIARFLTAKLSLGVVVEVTDRFGKSAGHRLSTVLSLIIAEPRLIALIVTGIWLVVEVIIWSWRRIRYERYMHRRGKHQGERMR